VKLCEVLHETYTDIQKNRKVLQITGTIQLEYSDDSISVMHIVLPCMENDIYMNMDLDTDMDMCWKEI
jgi:hypothetical protein